MASVIVTAEEEAARETIPKASSVSNPADFIQTIFMPACNRQRLMIKKILTLGASLDGCDLTPTVNTICSKDMVEAILFVFGYQRHTISSQIDYFMLEPYNHHVPCYSVTVHLQKILQSEVGDDHYTVVPKSKFILSRVTYLDNTSSFFLDNLEVTYSEVARVLRDKGVDLNDKRFLLMQEELDKIAMMKQKDITDNAGLVEFLEDIIGSDSLKQHQIILQGRLDTPWDKKSEKLRRIIAAKNDGEILEGSKNQAVEYLKLENAISKHLSNTDISDTSYTENKIKYDEQVRLHTKLSKLLNSVRELRIKKTDEYNKVINSQELLVVCEDCEEISEIENQGNSNLFIQREANIHKECAGEKKRTMETMKFNIEGLEKLEADMAEEEVRIKEKEDMYFQEVQKSTLFTRLTDKQDDCFENLHRQRLEKFMAAFQFIAAKLKEVYKIICPEGDAELMLVDPLRPVYAGILFRVKPPGKSWTNSSSLPKSERIMCSLALVIALHLYKPIPLYIVHGIDEAVHSKIMQIKEFCKDTQFIVIRNERE